MCAPYGHLLRKLQCFYLVLFPDVGLSFIALTFVLDISNHVNQHIISHDYYCETNVLVAPDVSSQHFQKPSDTKLNKVKPSFNQVESS
jgi:hypothetical protein